MKKIFNLFINRHTLYVILVVLHVIWITQELFNNDFKQAMSYLATMVWIIAAWGLQTSYNKSQDLCDKQQLLINEQEYVLTLFRKLREQHEEKIKALEAALAEEKKNRYTEKKSKTAGN